VSTIPVQDVGAQIAAYANSRGITEILHFTTNKGLIGVLAKQAVLCRDLLESDQYLEHIYTRNCADRSKAAEWTGYVNLSISCVNGPMFDSSERWHATEELWWAVLAFDASILADPGVVFATTNNTYPVVKRIGGVDGLAALFANRVPWGYYGSVRQRVPGMPDAWTTDVQAEVLYPAKIQIDRLMAVYVREDEHIDAVNALLGALSGAPRVLVACKPEVFQ